MDKSRFQNFIENFVQSFLSILKIILLSHSTKKEFKINNESDTCVILGNGPSLKRDFIDHPDFFKNNILIAVNHFAQSDMYPILQPKFYILNAPEMWMNDVEEFYFLKGEKLFNDIAAETKHNMYLFINQSASKYNRWKKILAQNPNIKIHYFNSTPVEGFKSLKHFIFYKQWGMPRTHNVLIPALMIALRLNFKKIFLAGADHNWLKDIYVSNDNRVFLTQKHFYDEQNAEKRPMDKLGKGERRLHEILNKFAISLNSYFVIERYSKSKNAKIINTTDGSFIDAFEKKRPEEQSNESKFKELKNYNILVVIPARGGSKGIPRKNLRGLDGKPLISYSIQTALNSKFKPDVYVSTDDPEIASISSKYGASTWMRNPLLAGDEITLDSVIYEAFENISTSNGKTYHVIVTLQPTSPLLKTENLDMAIQKMIDHSEIDTIISATNDTHLTWKKKNNEFVPNYEKRLNRQYLEPVYKETGSFLITRNSIIKPNTRIGKKVDLFILNQGEEIDIDTFEDWNLCEYFLRRKTIVFIVTGFPDVGLGHAYRTLQIANDILNHRIVFLTDSKSKLAYELIQSKNYEVYIQSEDNILNDIRKLKPHVIINDILDTDTDYMKSLKSMCETVINFEDLGEGAKYADIIINALYPDNYPGTNHYFGHNYFISRDEFRLSPYKKIEENIKNILLTFGGTDPCNLTFKVTESIYDFCIKNNIKIHIVTGPGYNNYESLSRFNSANLHKNISNISEYMLLSDIIFSSAGRTVYEIACLGTPAIIISQNKREESHFFASPENGFISLGLGEVLSNEKILETFKTLISDYNLRQKMNIAMIEKKVREGKKNVLNLLKNTISN